MKQWVIKDKMDDLIKIENRPYIFNDFNDAEECLYEVTGDIYETDQCEYEIQPIEGY